MEIFYKPNRDASIELPLRRTLVGFVRYSATFFTTKPTGQGTGLGLSMSYDIIIKADVGEMKVGTKRAEGGLVCGAITGIMFYLTPAKLC